MSAHTVASEPIASHTTSSTPPVTRPGPSVGGLFMESLTLERAILDGRSTVAKGRYVLDVLPRLLSALITRSPE